MAANNTPGAITDAQLDAGIAAWFGVTKVSPERAILRERMHAAIVAVLTTAAPGGVEAQARAIAWAAVHFGGKRDGKIYNTSDTREQIDAYIDQVHQSSDSLTLTARPLMFADAAHGAKAGSDAAHDVLAERQRQISAEGWTPEHDDGHVNDEIAAMACFYAMPPGAREWSAEDTGYGDTFGDAIIPEGWAAKEGDRRRELVKAGALILAEIERIDRSDARATTDTPSRGTAC